MKYNESTLQIWTAPLSDTEEMRVENTINMIKKTIENSADLSKVDFDVFTQGSYANNTNVKSNSDIDVCIMCTSTFFSKYPNGKTRENYGFSEGTITYREFKTYVVNAMIKTFGNESVSIGNKSIKIGSNSYHVQADVVPAFEFRNYDLIKSEDPQKYVSGIKFIAADGREVINYPKDHIQNGKEKNKRTNHLYKGLVRIFKHITNNMVSENLIDDCVK